MDISKSETTSVTILVTEKDTLSNKGYDTTKEQLKKALESGYKNVKFKNMAVKNLTAKYTFTFNSSSLNINTQSVVQKSLNSICLCDNQIIKFL